jgi:histidinol-phosphatase (PHP family)
MIDLHNHTLFGDAKNSPVDMAAEAKRKKLSVFGFSEHFPRPDGYDYPTGDFNHHFLASHWFDYVSEVMQLKTASKEKPKILLGVEIDYLPDEETRLAAELSAFRFDYIIGGVHMIGKWGFDYDPDQWEGKDPDRLYEDYYDILTAMTRSGLPDIVAHFDLIKIYKKRFPPKKDHTERARAVLGEIKKAGLFLEVNTGTLRKPCGEISPSPDLLRAAVDMKIPLVFGSDAHRVEDIAFSFDQTMESLIALGVQEIAYFEGRKPVFVPLTGLSPP